MATIVDALLVTLGLDVSGYKKGQKEAGDSLKKFGDRSAEETKKIEAQGKAMAEGFNKVKNEILGLVAVAMGSYGVKSFFENMVNGQASLARSSRDLGVSVKELDAWSAAATSVGGTADAFKNSMQSLMGSFESYARGQGGADVVQTFNNLKVAIADSEGKVRPMKDLMLDLAGALEGLPAQTQMLATSMLHLDDGTANLVRGGRARLAELFNQFERASKVTDSSTQAATKAQAQWALFGFRIKGVGNSIFASLAPAMEEANGLLLRFSQWVSDHSDDIGKFFADLAGWAVSAFKDGFSWIKENRGEIEGFFRNLATSFKDAFQWVKDNRGEIKGFFVDLVSVVETLAKTLNGIGKFGKWLFSSPFDPKPPKAPAIKPSSSAGAGRGSVNPGVSDVGGDADSQALFARLEKQYGLPAGMLDSMWKMESSRGRNMVGPVTKSGERATGHFQFMPGTAKEYGMTEADTYDLNKSAEAAAKYMSKNLGKYGGDVAKALAAYNWGPGNVDRIGLAGAPEETQNYIAQYRQMITPSRRAPLAVQSDQPGSTTETNINGPITIHTQATDADGIARDLFSSLQQESKLMNLATSSQY